MSIKRKEELLLKLHEWRVRLGESFGPGDVNDYAEIRRLIEQGTPRVSRKFVERKTNEYSLPLHWVFQLLREAGVEVEDE